jgi:hypothetical protein
MAFIGETFDVNELPQGTGGNYDPLPSGWYFATIAKAELTPTKDGSGQFIKLRYDITGPSHQGRVVFGNLNIKNASAKAEEIGRQQLGEVMRAIGLAKVTDTDQLIGGALQIKLAVCAATEQYAAKNEVKGFKSITGSAPAFSAQLGSAPFIGSAAVDSVPATSSKSAPPWAKK